MLICVQRDCVKTRRRANGSKRNGILLRRSIGVIRGNCQRITCFSSIAIIISSGNRSSTFFSSSGCFRNGKVNRSNRMCVLNRTNIVCLN